MSDQITYEDVATIGELMKILEEIAEKYGPEVEVMIQEDSGRCVTVSPTLTLPADWDPYDDGVLDLNPAASINANE